MTAWLAAAYAILLLAACWTLARAASIKVAAFFTAAAVALSAGLWLAIPDTSGYPTAHQPPKVASLIWGVVDEPDPQSGDPGRIYLWLDNGHGVPRAYRLPYTRQLHRQLQAGLQAIKHGQQMAVTHTVHGSSRGRTGSRNGEHGAWRIYPQPPPGLPPKGK